MHYLTFTSIWTVIINAAFGMTHSLALKVCCIQNLIHSHALYIWCIQNLQHSLLGQRANATFHECLNNASKWRLQECRCIQAFMHYNTFCWAAFVAYSIYQNLVCLLVCLAFRRVTMLLTLHSRCPSYASDFWLDCGLASALFWPVVLTHTHRQCSLSSVHPCRKPLSLSVVVSSTRRRLTPLSCSVPPPTTWWSRIQSSLSSALLLTRTTISWLKGCWPFSFVLHRVDIESTKCNQT